MKLTMGEAVAMYRRGNDAGWGYAPYTDIPGDDTIAEAVSAACELDGAEIVLDRTTSNEVVVLRYPDGTMVGIGGDAMGRGARAVTLRG